MADMGNNSGAGATTATAAPAPGAPVQPGADTTSASSSAPAAAPQLATQPTDQTVPLEDRVLKQQSFGSKLYHGILNALGGSQDVTFSRDPKTGQMITSMATSTPGSQWKRIISGALTGFAGAQAAGTMGPGGTMRGLAGGIQAGAQQRQATEQRMRGQADEDYKAQLENATNNLNNSLLAQKVAEATFQNQRNNIKADQEDIDRLNTFNQLVDDGGEGSQMLGVFKTEQDAYKFAADFKDVMGHHVNGRVVIMPNIEDGKLAGIKAAIVTPDWQNQTTTREYKIPIKEVQDGKLVDSTFTIPAGEKNGKVAQLLMSYAKEKQEGDLQDAQKQHLGAETAAIPEETRARVTEANANMLRTHIDEMKAPSEIALNEARAQAERDKIGDVEWGPEGAKGFDKWHKDMVQPALAVEQLYRMSSKVYNEYQALQKQGKDFPSGAQSVQMLSNHIAGTFGNVKGGRITRDLIEKHLGARSVSDTLETAVNRLVNGDQLSANQWNAFFQMIGDRREETWQTVMRDGQALGRPLQLVAFPEDFRQRNGLPARVSGAGDVLQRGTPAAGGAPPQKITIPANLPVSATLPRGAAGKYPGDDGQMYWVKTDGTPVAKVK